jgi:ribonucleotide monophosphatase NagD (HAD superfamily)
VLTGRTSASEIELWERKPDHVAEDLPAAVQWILGME